MIICVGSTNEKIVILVLTNDRLSTKESEVIKMLDEKLADSLKLTGNIKLTAKSVKEFDELMVKIERLKQDFPSFEMDAVAEWEIRATIPDACNEGINICKLTFKGIRNFLKIVHTIRKYENDMLEFFNRDRKQDEKWKQFGQFSCAISLKLEKKDKEAKRALEDSAQLRLFGPFIVPSDESEKRKFIEENRKLFEDFLPDGEKISNINIKHVDSTTGEVLKETSL